MIDIPDNILPRNDEGNAICPKCRHEVEKCTCPGYEPPALKDAAVKPVVRLDKKGRRGKTVTVISNLPCNEEYLKTLAKKLKAQTGSGGTHYIEGGTGVIEIQGEHRKSINLLIEKFGKL